MRLDLLYVLGSLWGGETGPQVCLASRAVPSGVTLDVARSLRPAAPAGVTAFVGVNVVPMDAERVLENQTVLIDGGRITALGPASRVTVPAGAVRVDGRGKYLIPGLADMHGHVGAQLEDGDYDRRARLLFSYLAHGVTAVRQLGAGDINDQRQQMLLRLKTALANGEILGPRFYLAPPMQWSRQHGLTPRLDSVTAYIAAAKAAGHAFIAMPNRVEEAEKERPSPATRAVIDSILAAARRVGLPVSSHNHHPSFEHLLALGRAGGSVEHLHPFRDTLGLRDTAGRRAGERKEVDVPAAAMRAVAAATQGAGTWITVTLTCQARGKRSPSIEVARRLVKTLQDAGVGLLLGADLDVSGYRSPSVAHDELALLVSAGLSPYQALLVGTRNVAQYFRMLDSSGTVAVGKRADLVLLHRNPLADIRHTRDVVGTMIAGRWLDRTALDHGLLADPKYWFNFTVRGSGITPPPGDKKGRFFKHSQNFDTLTDSLAIAKPSESARLRQRLADELGGIRASLTPEQQVVFDPHARVWLREQARQGYQIAVPGVRLVP